MINHLERRANDYKNLLKKDSTLLAVDKIIFEKDSRKEIYKLRRPLNQGI